MGEWAREEWERNEGATRWGRGWKIHCLVGNLRNHKLTYKNVREGIFVILILQQSHNQLITTSPTILCMYTTVITRELSMLWPQHWSDAKVATTILSKRVGHCRWGGTAMPRMSQPHSKRQWWRVIQISAVSSTLPVLGLQYWLYQHRNITLP